MSSRNASRGSVYDDPVLAVLLGMMTCYDLSNLSAETLVSQLKNLVASDHRLTAQMLAHIAEVDLRKLYLDEACTSMFVYCTSCLHMSEGAAFNRIEAARAARCFPIIFEHVASGALHLTAVRRLAPRLTPENHLELLSAAMHLCTRDVERLIAVRFPRPDVATCLRKLPVRTAETEATFTLATPVPCPTAVQPPPSLAPATTMAGAAPTAFPLATVPPAAPRSACAEVKPLSATRYSLKVTLSESTHDKLLELQALLRHRIPGGEIDAVLDHALGVALRELHKEKFGETDKPRERVKPPKEGSRHVPNAVKREVAARDGHQCTFVDEQGRRCQARSFLEFDHIEAFALGGASDRAANIRLRCKLCRARHNLHYPDHRIMPRPPFSPTDRVAVYAA